jgi:hypothetical protein
MNILNIIREQLSPELLGQVSQRVGEPPEAAASAMENSMQALLGSAAAKASSPEGSMGLFNLLKDKTPSDGWPSSAAALLGNLTGGGGGIGTSLVNLLLGSKANMIRDFIANRSGVRPESATTLLGTAGSLLMGVLGRQVASQSLGASSFGQFLRSQIPHLQGHLSPDLTNVLGVGNLFSSTKAVPPPASYANQASRTEPVEATSYRAPAPAGKILRFALIPIALLLGLLFLANRHSRNANVGAANDETYTSRAVTAGSTVIDTARADLASLTDRLKNAISGTDAGPVDLTGLGFDNSGTVSPTARNVLSSLGSLMSDNPSVKADITTYGRTTEEAAARGNSIKSALLRMGITADRIVIHPEIGESVPKVHFIK